MFSSSDAFLTYFVFFLLSTVEIYVSSRMKRLVTARCLKAREGHTEGAIEKALRTLSTILLLTAAAAGKGQLIYRQLIFTLESSSVFSSADPAAFMLCR